jgi:multiple sugar transport system ATP-binding protein
MYDSPQNVFVAGFIGSPAMNIGTFDIKDGKAVVGSAALPLDSAVLKDGLLQQVGTPREMYDNPANVFVAGFIGSPAMNIGTFDVDAGSGTATVGSAALPIDKAILDQVTADDEGKITVGFRPESLDVVAAGTPGSLQVETLLVEELGSDAFLYGTLTGDAAGAVSAGETDQVIVRIDPRNVPMKGDIINVAIKPGHTHLFSASSGLRLN